MKIETAQNVKQVAFGGFIGLALLYLAAWLLAANDFYPAITQTVAATVDLPMYLAALVLATASAILGLHLIGPVHRYTIAAIWIFASALLVALTILDLFAQTT